MSTEQRVIFCMTARVKLQSRAVRCAFFPPYLYVRARIMISFHSCKVIIYLSSSFVVIILFLLLLQILLTRCDENVCFRCDGRNDTGPRRDTICFCTDVHARYAAALTKSEGRETHAGPDPGSLVRTNDGTSFGVARKNAGLNAAPDTTTETRFENAATEKLGSFYS